MGTTPACPGVDLAPPPPILRLKPELKPKRRRDQQAMATYSCTAYFSHCHEMASLDSLSSVSSAVGGLRCRSARTCGKRVHLVVRYDEA